MNSDTQGETVDYVYMLKIAPINDPIIAKFLTVKNAATLQEPKQPEAKKKYPDDFGMTGFGFVRRYDTGMVSKGFTKQSRKRSRSRRNSNPQAPKKLRQEKRIV